MYVTFIDTPMEPSALLDSFFQERQVITFPASRVEQMTGLFEEAESDGPRHSTADSADSTDSTDSTAVPPPGAIISPADSLGLRRTPSGWPAMDGSMNGVEAVPPPLGAPAPGSPELPSVGSAGHAAGRCKPCAFFDTVGCESGPACAFCHLCKFDERKRRRKDHQQAKRLEMRLRRSRRDGEERAA